MPFAPRLAGARLDEKLGALRASGQPMSLPDLAGPTIPPERNAATYLRRAQDGLEAIEQEIEAAWDELPEDEQKAFDEGQPRAGLIEAMRAALAAHPEAMSLADEASHCPDYDSGFDLHTDTDTFIEAVAWRYPALRG